MPYDPKSFLNLAPRPIKLAPDEAKTGNLPALIALQGNTLDPCSWSGHQGITPVLPDGLSSRMVQSSVEAH